jgi:hypothetical protein
MVDVGFMHAAGCTLHASDRATEFNAVFSVFGLVLSGEQQAACDGSLFVCFNPMRVADQRRGVGETEEDSWGSTGRVLLSGPLKQW